MFPSLNDTARLDFDLTWRSILFYAILDSVLRIGFAKSILLLPPSGPSREKQNDKKNFTAAFGLFFSATSAETRIFTICGLSSSIRFSCLVTKGPPRRQTPGLGASKPRRSRFSIQVTLWLAGFVYFFSFIRFGIRRMLPIDRFILLRLFCCGFLFPRHAHISILHPVNVIEAYLFSLRSFLLIS